MKRLKSQIGYIFLFLYLSLIFVLPSVYLNSPKLFIVNIVRFPLYLSDRTFYNIKFLMHSKALIAENKDLRNKLQDLKSKAYQLEELKTENERLKNILAFKNESQFNFIAAQIIAKDSTSISNSIIISAGKKEGVGEKTVVITPSGVVGRVVESSSSTSRVMLITDPDSHISAIDSRSRCEGMLYGISGGLCRMEYLPLDADIKKGDIIITSSFSSIFPKGLMLGEIVEVQGSSAELSLSALVKPDFEFSQLEEVLCIK